VRRLEIQPYGFHRAERGLYRQHWVRRAPGNCSVKSDSTMTPGTYEINAHAVQNLCKYDLNQLQ